MKNWRLRTRLTLWSAFVTALALLTLGVVAAINVYSEEVEEIDEHLVANSAQLFTESVDLTTRDWKATDHSAELLKNFGALYGYVIIGPTGEVEHAFPQKFALPAGKRATRKKFFFSSSEGKRLRVGVFGRETRILLIAADAAPARETVSKLVSAYFLALPIVLLVVGAGSWWMAGRALQPIVAITRAAAAITAERLDARLPIPKTKDEIGEHIRVLNEMFDRLQRSFEQATRFTADASHELRTPLTVLRGEIEEALREIRANPEYENRLVSLLEQVSALQKISANLLLLARFDAGKNQLERTTLDWSALIVQAAEDAELLASPMQISIVAEIAKAVFVEGDLVLLRRVLLNLIDNAVRYNHLNGEVRLALSVEAGVAVFAIANTGRGIPSVKHRELFQRFFRIDHDRSRATGGSGLGLSLCREIVHAHGGSIKLSRSDLDWVEFTVCLATLGSPIPAAREKALENL